MRFTFKNNRIKRTDIIQYNLPNFNEDFDTAWYHILTIYETVLKKDYEWHFFYEGHYNIIRCQNRYTKKLEKYFKENDIEFERKGVWKGDHWAVEKYREHFTRMFHDFSLLALKMAEGEIQAVADRIIHPFYNHCTYLAETYRKKLGEHAWEGHLMASLTASRSIHSGRLVQCDLYKKARKKEENKENGHVSKTVDNGEGDEE